MVEQLARCGLTHLVFGGARSGKTGFALALANQSGFEKFMVATAISEDDEMARRIEKHRAERDSHWQVIEEGVELDAVLRDLARPDRVIVVDCMTLWLSNLFLRQLDMKTELAKLMADFETIPGLIVFVSNELGQGLAPDTTLGRSFRDEHGLMNQILASACSRVTLVAAGLPLVLK